MRFFTDELQNGTFVANYTLNTSINAPTELFFNEEVYYPTGYKLSILINNAPSKTLTIDKSQKNYIKILETNPENNGKTVSIVLTKKLNKDTNNVKESEDKTFKVEYQVEEQEPLLSGYVYFKIFNVKDLGNDISFEIVGADGSVLCSGNNK